MDAVHNSFKPGNRGILTSLVWERDVKLVVRGAHAYRAYHASIPEGHRFWDLWRVNKAALEERGFRVRSSFPDGWRVEISLPDPDGLKELLAQSSATQSDLEVPAPPGRRYYDFQRAGVEFLDRHPGALLGSDMGVGKTIQLIGLLNLRPEIRAALIICPASVKLVWRREFESWLLPGRTVAIVGGPDFEKADIWIINYEQLQKYQAQLRARRLDLLVCDESHFIKNPKSIRSKLARALGPLAARRVLLSGTPVLNKPAELWAQLNLIDPAQWPKFFPFATRYCDAHRNSFGWDFSGASHLDELNVRLRTTCMLRHRKADVLDQLPAITRSLVPLTGVNPSGEQRQELDGVTREIAAELGMGVEELLSSSSGPDFDPEEISFGCAARARAILGTLKLGPALQFIHEESDDYPDTKYVVFAHHLVVLHGLHEGLPGSVLVTGETPLKERQQAIDRFQTDPGVRHFVASIRAMSLGVTLTAASRIVLTEFDWTPAINEQAESRCHRIGQREAVSAQYLTAPGTIDDAVMRAVAAKMEIISATIER